VHRSQHPAQCRGSLMVQRPRPPLGHCPKSARPLRPHRRRFQPARRLAKTMPCGSWRTRYRAAMLTQRDKKIDLCPPKCEMPHTRDQTASLCLIRAHGTKWPLKEPSAFNNIFKGRKHDDRTEKTDASSSCGGDDVGGYPTGHCIRSNQWHWQRWVYAFCMKRHRLQIFVMASKPKSEFLQFPRIRALYRVEADSYYYSQE
jgi:hypothetical protein